MHHELTQLISDLLGAADTPAGKRSLKNGIMDLVKLAQTVPDQRFLTRLVAKSMTSTVEAVFGPLSLIFILTEPGRRQIYLAVLARLAEEGLPEAGAARDRWRKQFLVRLLLESDEDLIAEAYGHCPTGFVRVLKRLGQLARGARTYTGLFRLLSESPGLANSLLNTAQTPLTDDIIELLVALPRGPRAMKLAKSFEHPVEYRRFMDTYSVLTGERTLRDDHITRLCSGEAPATLLQGLYFDMSFGAPVISMPGIRYISTGAELVQVSNTFRNCLKNYVAEAIRGERQYYVWEKRGEPAVVFAISADKPFGWHLSECKLAQNERVPEPLSRELESLLEFAGVRTTGSIENMMGHFLNRHCDDELDEILQNIAA